DRALLRDRALELSEPARELGGVLRIEHLDAEGRVCRRLGEPGSAQGEVLQREPERLRVGELAFEEVERSLQRGQLVVPEIELREERSEEHTSELQSRGHLVCRLLLEKKKKYV